MSFANAGQDFSAHAEGLARTDLPGSDGLIFLELDHAAFLEGHERNPVTGFVFASILGGLFWLALAGMIVLG